MAAEPKCEWKFNHRLDEPGLLTLENRQNGDKIAAWWNQSYATATTPSIGSWVVDCSRGEAVQLKIVPSRNNDNSPRFRFKPQEKGIRDRFPFNKEWQLDYAGV